MSDDLVTCDVCEKEISKWAEICPHCGDPRNRDEQTGCISGILRFLWTTILIVLIVRFLIFIW